MTGNQERQHSTGPPDLSERVMKVIEPYLYGLRAFRKYGKSQEGDEEEKASPHLSERK